MKKLLTILTFAAACSVETPPPQDFGEAVQQFASGWCQARDRCGIGADPEYCTDHNIFHLCEAEQTCSTEWTLEEEFFFGCLENLGSINEGDESCLVIRFGGVPHECNEVIRYIEARNAGL